MVTDEQVRRLLAMKNKVEYLYQLADKAGMSTKTAHKYLKSGVLPSQRQTIHDWPTHPDAFAQDWSWVEDFLENNSGIESKSLRLILLPILYGFYFHFANFWRAIIYPPRNSPLFTNNLLAVRPYHSCQCLCRLPPVL